MKIGLIGCGAWGQFILRDLVSLNCEVYVVARSKESIARAEQHRATRVVHDLNQLPEVAGYVVATSTTTHADLVMQLLPKNKPIFVEKVLAPNPHSAQKIAALGQGQVFVMDKWRYHLGVQKLRELTQNLTFGKLLGIKTTRIGWGNPHLDCDTIWHLTSHDLSIVYEILGTLPDATYAYAEILDQPVALHGILGRNPFVQIEVSSRSQILSRKVSLHFEKAVATLGSGYDNFIEVAVDNQNLRAPVHLERIEFAQEMPLYAELEAFIEHLRGGVAPKSSAQEAALFVQRIEELRLLAGLPASASE